jgi:hypothetical protein
METLFHVIGVPAVINTQNSVVARVFGRPDPRLVLWALTAYLFTLGGVFVAL